jgi:hypothetical protein
VYDSVKLLLLASPLSKAPLELVRGIVEVVENIVLLVEGFRQNPVTPQAAEQFETQLATLLRQLGRVIVAWTYNDLEPEPALLPRQLQFQGEYYRRGNKSKRRGQVWTLFGPITLVRCIYRHWYCVEPSVFPLEVNLGIEPGGATPALAMRAAWLAADNTQQQTLEILKADHAVTWSVATLRKTVESVSRQMSEHRHDAQLDQLLRLLELANRSSGNRKIVLSVGRDGIFTPVHEGKKHQYQEGAAATLAVYGRSGKRLGTVYLGRMPEAYQTTLSDQLTQLITDVLGQWKGPMPRLCYVTDAGFHPAEYFQKTLRWMRHPQTGKLLHWEWVVDYFHVCGYISKLAEAIFGPGKEAFGWARKMRRWLKTKPNGAYRVLHSAAALKSKRKLNGSQKDYDDAYNYLCNRLGYLNYVDYRRRGLPIGSGVTEAACKIVFTQRLKQSGMAWTIKGGQTILNLRVLRLSKVWNHARDAYLRARPTIPLHPRSESQKLALAFKNAA